MCLDDVVVAFYRRVFHTWRRRCAAESGGQLNTRSSDSAVNDSGSECLDFDNRQDKEKENVVLDAETFQQMIDELKTLKLTILHLQRMLLQNCTGESNIYSNDNVDASGSVTVQHSPENQELRKRVNELEKLAWEQRKIIDGLKQTSVTEPLCVGCSSDVTSSADVASSAHERFRFVNGGIEKQNICTGHHFTDKYNVTRNYQYRTNGNSVLGSSSGDAHKSSRNSMDFQLENKPHCGRKMNPSQCTFSTETGKNFVRPRTRSDEESTMDCSMFDYDGTVDSDRELDLGEPSECKHSRQMGNKGDLGTRGLNRVIEKRGNTGSEVACDQQGLGEHLGNMTDFHSGLSDGCYEKFSLAQQGKIGLDFSVSEDSIASSTKLIAEAEEEVDGDLLVESFQTRENFDAFENLLSERKNFMSKSNDVGENSVPDTDSSARTRPDDMVLRSNSQSLIRMPKSYDTSAAERNVKRLDDSVPASTPTGAVCDSLLNTGNTVQPKSPSLRKTTKQSREICTSKLPSSNASKLPASIAK